MSMRVIPILPVREPLVAAVAGGGAPRLDGDPGRVQRLLRELQDAVDLELGVRLPASAWLRELRLDDDECVVALSPGLRQRGQGVAEATFATLRRVLSDTDIYVGAAA